MKKIIAIAAVAVIGIAGMFILWNNDVNPFSNDGDAVYTESNLINLPMEKLRTLNPVTSKDADTYQISKLLFESLFTLDETLAPQNQLATSYVYNADELSAEIMIKKDSYFSDGTNLTAEDVKFSIESYMSAGVNSIYHSYVSNIKKVMLDNDDDYKLVVKFKSGTNVSEDNFTFPILSKKSFGKYSPAKVVSSKFIPIGSGPYAIESYNEITDLTLIANEHYRGEKPENTLCFTILPQDEDIIPLLDVSNMAMGVIEDLSRDTLIADKNVTSQNFVSNEVEVIGFNFGKETMKNKKLRQAVAYSLDSQTLIETAYYKNAISTDTIVYPGYLGTENAGDKYSFNMDKAKELLASAKYTDKDEDGYIDDEFEKNLELVILVNGQDFSRTLVAKALKENLDKLNVYSTIVYANTAEEFSYKLMEGSYDVFVGGLNINEKYDLRSLLHTDYGNIIRYSNPKADVLMDKLKSGISVEKQKGVVEDLKKILVNDIPYYPICYKQYGALVSEAFQGNDKGYMFNNFYRHCIDWYCKYKVQEEPEVVDSIETL